MSNPEQPVAPERPVTPEEERARVLEMFMASGDRAGLAAFVEQQIERERERARREALHDELTSLPRRELFKEFAGQRIAEAASRAREQGAERRAEAGEGSDFNFLIIDIDHFKRINDTQGHEFGDRVLAKVAAVLQAALRKGDLICRWGGEEFVVGFTSTAAEARAQVAEKLRAAIEDAAIEYPLSTGVGDAVPTRVTVSIGASRWHPGESLTDIYEAADQALYQAKTAGRNRAVVAE